MFYTGWIEDVEGIKDSASALLTPYFSDTECANMHESDLPKEVCLWHKVKVATGIDLLPVRDQKNVGSCVGHGVARAIEYTNCIEIANGEQEVFHPLSRIVLYAGSRYYIGNNKYKDQDGSLGIWAARFANEYGNMDEDNPQFNLSYDAVKCREMGNKPFDVSLLQGIKDHKVQTITNIANWVEAKKALFNGYGISICSKLGFEKKRGAEGICKVKGIWGHCQMISGYCTIKDKEYAYVENSWGNYLGEDNMPPNHPNVGTYLIEAETAESIFKEKDCWAYSGLAGFVKKHIEWKV